MARGLAGIVVRCALALLVVLAAPAVADGATRYADPGGVATNPCTAVAPCDIATAINGAVSGDTVIVNATPETYGTPTGRLTTPLLAAAGVTVQGSAMGDNRPVIYGSSALTPTLMVYGRAQDLVLDSDQTYGGLGLGAGGSASRITAIGRRSRSSACSVYGPGVTLTDSVCNVSADGTQGIGLLDINQSDNSTFRNSTFVGTLQGMNLKSRGDTIVNSIIPSSTSGNAAVQTQYAATFSYSQYLSLFSGEPSVEEHIVTARPQLRDDLHQADGAPSIDQGTDTGAGGPFDIDGQARKKGAAVDIGADEYAPIRYAAPGTADGAACSQSDPCSLATAINGATRGDTVMVASGDYGSAAAPLTTKLVVAAGVAVKGAAQGAGRPVIYGEVDKGTVLNVQGSAQDLVIHGYGTFGALLLQNGAFATRITALGGDKADRPCTASGGGGNTLTDSVCWSADGSGFLDVAGNLTLRNVDILGRAYGFFSSARGDVVTNSILQATNGLDVYASPQFDAQNSIRLDHVQYVDSLGAIDESASVKSAPQLVDPAHGDFHQKPGAPSVDAGVDADANGPMDFEGDARTIGARTDIGADEAPLPTLTATVAAADVTRHTMTLRGSVDTQGAPGTAYFEYGTTAGSYPSSTPTQSVSGKQDVSATIKGLAPGTKVFYRLVVQVGTATARSDEGSATTTTAAPTTRYADPAGTANDTCSATSPCDVATAINEALSGDTVIVGSGDYGKAMPLTTQLGVPAGVTVKGAGSGAARPVIYGAVTTGPVLLVEGQVQDLVVDSTQRFGALGLRADATATRISALGHATSGYGCTLFGANATLTDSVCAATGTGSIGIVDFQGGRPATLRNNDLVGVSAGLELHSAGHTIVNSIIDATGSATVDGTVFATVTFDHDQYATIDKQTGAAPTETNIVHAPPALDGAFRQQPGAPSINAGIDADANGPQDFEGDARRIGAATDIGADEAQLPTPTASVANADITRHRMTLHGTANTGGLAGTAYFEYDTVADRYGSQTATTTLTATSADQAVTAKLTVDPGTEIYYRLVVQTGGGKATSDAILATTPAAPTTRYVSTGGNDNDACRSTAPCDLPSAVAGSISGDTVVVAPGHYGAAMPYTAQIVVPAGVTLQGAKAGGDRPVIDGDVATGPLLLVDGTAQDLVVNGGGGFGALGLRDGGTATRINATNPDPTGGSACSSYGTGGTLTDSVCWGVARRGLLDTSGHLTLRNDTIVGQVTGLHIQGTGDTIVNCIFHADDGDDILADFPADVDHSQFERVSGRINATNTTAAPPRFVDAANGDFRQAPDAPSIDAGVDAAANGAQDFEGDARTIGARTDIGADEAQLPAPTATLSRPDVTRHTVTLRGTVDTKGLAGTYRFEYGPDATYTTHQPDQAVSGRRDVSLKVTGLSAGQRLYFRLVVETDGGKTTSQAGTVLTTDATPTTRYAGPRGDDNDACTRTSPCDLPSAVAGAVSGDEIVVAPGNYGPYSEQIDVPAGVALKGAQVGSSRPVISGAASTGPLLLVDGTAQDLVIHGGGLYGALGLRDGGTGTRITATNQDTARGFACGTYGSGATLTDSVCWSVTGTGLEDQHGNVTLRNDTLVGKPAGFLSTASGNLVVNSIMHSTAGVTDVYDSGGTTFDHDQFETSRGTSTPPTVNAAPRFVDAAHGDFHQAADAPSIDAGMDADDNGPQDFDGDPRTIGAATDIGADEAQLPEPAVELRDADVTRHTMTLHGTAYTGGLTGSARFEYGTVAGQYGSSTPVQALVATSNAQDVSATIEDLAPGTEVFFRLVVETDGGSASAGPQSATTTAIAPTTRYVAPDGTDNDECTRAKPCSIGAAVNEAVDGDTVVLPAGSYGTERTPLTTPLVVPAGVRVNGTDQPEIWGSVGDDPTLRVDGSVQDLTVHGTGPGGALGLGADADVTRVVALGTGDGATCATFNTGATLTNSVCHAAASVAFLDDFGQTRLANDDLLGQGVGLKITARATGDVVTNTIIRSAGGQPDVLDDGAATLDHNAYRSRATSAGTATVDRTAVTAAPKLDEDFRQAPDSPTVGAGIDTDASQPTDVEGDPRTVGTHTDIGADELSPAPAPEAAVTDPDVKRHKLTLHGTVDTKGLAGEYHFEYGPAADDLRTSTDAEAVTGQASPTTLITRLDAGETVFYRLVARTDGGRQASETRSVTTSSTPTTRYASPDGTGNDDCPSTDPCDLVTAINEAIDGDTVLVKAGDYDVRTVLNPDQTILTVQGEDRPHLSVAGNVKVAGTWADLRIETGGAAFFDDDAVATRLVVRSEEDACVVEGSDVELTDSVCSTTDAASAAMTVDGPGANLRNDTFVGAGTGLLSRAEETSVVNSIMHGGDVDLVVAGGDLTTGYDEYVTARGVTPAATDLLEAPRFVDAANGDFHQAKDAPSVDAGVDDDANGPLDFEGDARRIGGQTDIGADELVDISPTAVADDASLRDAAVRRGTPVDVLANDTDPDGGPKKVKSVTQPATGTVTINARGAGVSYQSASPACRDKLSFTYTLNGGSTTTVTITIACGGSSSPPAATPPGQPASGTSPAPAQPATPAPPALDVVLSRRARKHGRGTVAARCGTACRLTARGTIRAGRKRLGTVRFASLEIGPGQTVRGRLALSKATRRRLRRYAAAHPGRPLVARVTFTATDADGQTDRVRVRMTVR